jgi:hypothetical protein
LCHGDGVRGLCMTFPQFAFLIGGCPKQQGLIAYEGGLPLIAQKVLRLQMAFLRQSRCNAVNDESFLARLIHSVCKCN